MIKKELQNKVQTVLGLINPEELGVTLPHEHFLIDTSTWFKKPITNTEKRLAYQPVSLENLGWVRYHPQNSLDNMKLTDEQLAIKESLRYKNAGGKSIVDLTPIGIGRDPLALVRISKATGLNIIMGSGYYVKQSIPPEVKLNESNITEEIVHDILEGVGKTGVHAGIIGEIGMQWPTNDWERMILRAAANAQKRTGVAISVHPGWSPNSPFDAIKILSGAGTDPRRVIICHIERTIFEYNKLVQLAKTGCFLEFDTFSIDNEPLRMVVSEENPIRADWPSDSQRVNIIAMLINEGFLDQILISTDMCRKHRLWSYGGPGYAHILENIVPLMQEKDIPNRCINTIIMENPKRLLQLK